MNSKSFHTAEVQALLDSQVHNLSPDTPRIQIPKTRISHEIISKRWKHSVIYSHKKTKTKIPKVYYLQPHSVQTILKAQTQKTNIFLHPTTKQNFITKSNEL